MNYSKECPFCDASRFQNNEIAHLPTLESILFQNENLYVQVDISPLMRGHILIISNHHYLNFYEIPKDIKKDIILVMEKIKAIYRELYHTDVLFFEHGSAQSGYAGASIDHAHLHCVPYFSEKLDIKKSLDQLFGNGLCCDILANNDFENEFSYLYFENEKDGKFLYKVSKLPSQFLRKLIAEKLGDDIFLWQEKCITPNSRTYFQQTISDLNGKIIL